MTAPKRLAGAIVLALLACAGHLRAQGAPGADTIAATVAPVPFGPGEEMHYKVSLGLFGTVGEGSMKVLGIEEVRGHPTYHLRFDLEGDVWFAEVDDRMESWLDVAGLFSRRFHEDKHELDYERERTYEFYPEQWRWELVGTDKSGILPSKRPLDELSFVYFARTLPLEVGDTYRFYRYFEPDGNPVIIKVLRKETVTVPAGTFRTVVVRPIIQTDGLFGKGGKAEIYFTDDERRILVQMKSDVPVLGSLNLYLESYTPGRDLSTVAMDSLRSVP